MSDPTIQSPLGQVPPESVNFAVSLAEIDAMGLKAARGAGYSWGLAEEAGRAARWLAAYRLCGPEALSALLAAVHGDPTAHAPKREAGRWFATGGRLCPIALGASLSDRAEAIAAGEAVQAEAVLYPLLLLPFLSRAARDLHCCFQLQGDGFRLLAIAEGPSCSDWQRLGDCHQSDLTLTRASARAEDVRQHGWRGYPIAAAVWQDLGQWAHRTYVPASEASRLAGAGAGRSDND